MNSKIMITNYDKTQKKYWIAKIGSVKIQTNCKNRDLIFFV